MESENSDLLDRRLMALYGVHSENPTKMDQHGLQSKGIIDQSRKKNIDRFLSQSVDANVFQEIRQLDCTTQTNNLSKLLKMNLDRSSRGSSESKRNPFIHDYKTSTADQSVEQFLDTKIARIDSLDNYNGISNNAIKTLAPSSFENLQHPS